MRLYEISNSLSAILDTEDGELTDDAEARLTDLSMAYEQKVEACLQYREGLLAEQRALAGEMDRLQERAARLTKKADWLKGYILQSMIQTNVGKVSTATFSCSVAKSPMKVVLGDGFDIPIQYQRTKTTVEFDKTAVLNDFKEGKELPAGVTVTQGKHLKIS